MKFYEIRIQAHVLDGMDRTIHEVPVRITMSYDATPEDAAQALAEKLETALNTIDIGDCE